MSLPVYSTRFAVYEATSTGEHDLYTFPDGYVGVLRDIDIVLAGAGAYDVYIGGAGLALAHYLASSITDYNLPWRGRQVFEAGETLYTTVSAIPTSGNITIWMSGYLLTLP